MQGEVRFEVVLDEELVLLKGGLDEAGVGGVEEFLEVFSGSSLLFEEGVVVGWSDCEDFFGHELFEDVSGGKKGYV